MQNTGHQYFRQSFPPRTMLQESLGEKSAFSPAAKMLHLIAGLWLSHALYLVAYFGIADLLTSGAKSAEELAQATGTEASLLHRVLRALASEGIFSEDDSGRFSLTPLAATLRSDVPDSLRSLVLAELGEEAHRTWENVRQSMTTDGVVPQQRSERNEEETRTAHTAKELCVGNTLMHLPAAVNAAVLVSYHFSGFDKLVDVGGGDGTFLTFILQAHARAQGILFELPQVAEHARQRIAEEGLVERCHVVTGDFFASVPSGGDAYILKWVLHEWENEHAVRILRNCQRAMLPQSRLLLIEAVIPRGNEPFFHKWLDLNRLMKTGGRERTAAEYQALLRAAGLKLTRLLPTSTEVSIVEAVRA
jgi:hypothetical protein